jgi:hypothetical protein
MNTINIKLENGTVINYNSYDTFEEAEKIAKSIAGDILAITAFALEIESSENAKIYVNNEFICNCK